jgi:hypothetical protein
MNSKLHAKIVTMAAATLGLSMMAGCAKKAEPAPAAAEGGATAAGAESSCGAGSCGAAHQGEHKEGAEAPAEEAAPAQ